jgi:DNA-binding GntR family transcriptional regulator
MTRLSFYRRVILGLTKDEDEDAKARHDEHEQVLDALEWSDTDSAKELAERAEHVGPAATA